MGNEQSGSIFEQPQFDVPQNLENPPAAGNNQQGYDPGNAFLNAPPPEYSGAVPVYEESKTRYYIIFGAVFFFVLVFGGVLAFLVMRGGGDNSAGDGVPPEPVTLTYWGLWEDETIYADLIAEYQQENPHVTIQYEMMEPEQYRVKLIERAQNGVGPDIFRFHNTWLPQLTEVAASIPPDIISNEEFERTFYSIHQSDLGYDGSYFGIPLSIDGLVLVSNWGLFERGGEIAPPTSWLDDLPEVVGDLTVRSEEEIVTSGIALGTATNVEHFSEIFGMILLQNGGSIDNLDSQAAAEALQVYRDFAEEGIWDETMPNSTQAFIEERVAMIIVPSWQVITIISANPELDIRVDPVPRGLDSRQLSLATYWVEGVSKFSPNQVEAWKFLRFLATQESLEKKFALQSELRPFGTAYSRVDMSEKLRDHPYLGAVIQQADFFETMPVVNRTFDEGLNDGIVQYLENAVNETVNGVSYEGALGTAHTGVTQVLNRFDYTSFQNDQPPAPETEQP